MSDRVPTSSRLVARTDLAGDDLDRMYRLFEENFDGVSQEQFLRDIEEKNWAILIERGVTLVGFSTILAYETVLDDAPLSVIYSGDTIVSREAWNTSILPRVWIESVAALRRHYPRGPYVWLLITSGFRTYRFLPLFWRGFYPRFDAQTPRGFQRMMEHLAGERFGEQYDRARGIVKFRQPQRLRDDLSGIPVGRSNDPHVAFFAEKNPGHSLGDELVCITELTPENLTPAGRRMTALIQEW